MTELDISEARQIASEWHGGMSSPLYALASSGTAVSGLTREVAEDLATLRTCGQYNAQEIEAEEPRLQALLEWAKANEPIERYSGEVGCLLDGHFGIYNIPRVIEIALDYGMPMSDEESAHWATKDEEPDTEYMIEWSESAEQWLNANVANDGFSFGWHDGEFFYWATETWQEEG